MSKAPADQFYFGDYIRDTRMLSLEARGAWMDILAHSFFMEPQGRISQNLKAWGRMFGCSAAKAKRILLELQEHNIGDVKFSKSALHVTLCNANVTVINRRKYNEWLARNGSKQRVKRHRESNSEKMKRKCNANVTALSSSSSSTSTSSSSDIDLIDQYQGLIKRTLSRSINQDKDPRLVEIGILYTLLNRNGSTEPIKSVAYFQPEIEKVCLEAKGMGSKAIDALLLRRREQWQGHE